MRAKVTSNDAEFSRLAGEIVSRLTKAQQDAVNAAGVRVLTGLRTAMEEELDRPTKFTLNAFSLWRARGRHTDAAIVIKPVQAAYLQPVFAGGHRADDVIPSKKARLNSMAT
ncbi:hypothetical protein [Tianweitania sediminis]|uniref:Uncharacterized protein n=1 Tax=Tianweitania sediminis TaxID=1502156 RepID=A0A8J7R504_9HYPH|nr:hypothetical protein [Tianweitania sediminis]MBP0439900.1 hypothetical protein [Tianweitania sediminis]